MLGRLFDALREAGAPEDSARAAAEEVAAYEGRFSGIEAKLTVMEGRLDSVDSRLGLLTWAIGINVAVTLAVLARLLTLH